MIRTRALVFILLLAAASLAPACDTGDARGGAREAARPAGADGRVAPAGARGDATRAPVRLAPIDHSGVTGTVAADRDAGGVVVTVVLQGLDPGAEYSAYVREGRCAAGGGMVLPLDPVRIGPDGTGTSRVRTTGAALPTDSSLFVQVHAPSGRPVACADLPTGRGTRPRATEPDPERS